MNTASIAALTGGAGPIVYRVSKAAVVQFSRCMPRSTSPTTASASTASRPGHIATGITNYDMGPVIKNMQPLQRHGDPSDVAEAVLYLVSDRVGAGHRHRAADRRRHDRRPAGRRSSRTLRA